MENFIAIVQLVLAIAAVWYTIETRKLRLQNEAQMKLLREQTRLSVTPHLVPGVVDIDLLNYKKKVSEDKELSEDDKRRKLEQAASGAVKFVCAVQNPTTKTPNHVSIYVYDERTKSFLLGDASKEYIGEKDSELFWVSHPYCAKDKLIEVIGREYGTGAEFIFDHLTVDDESYVLLVFRDLEGRIYASKRKFKIGADGEANHRPSALFFRA